MPRHHFGLQKNAPDTHYIRCRERRRPARPDRHVAYRQIKTPRCVPGCL
ncbi:hypothetical protein L810_7077 [Burkholderia sp. AU4i]|nr:hypothetical protein L810_7077 [Burkholderia sp. AU4i]MDW9228195.1 hypothetical protein [Burkholderia cepacia]MDW9243301.1 hypothetical protein [Burkholderia cepacia]QOH34169.1 hypothetical protein C7S14_5302 [Burkholderia cepacia]